MAGKAGLARMERLGFGAIEPAAGAAAFGAALRSLNGGGAASAPQLTGSVFLWDRCALAFVCRAAPGTLRGCVQH